MNDEEIRKRLDDVEHNVNQLERLYDKTALAAKYQASLVGDERERDRSIHAEHWGHIQILTKWIKGNGVSEGLEQKILHFERDLEEIGRVRELVKEWRIVADAQHKENQDKLKAIESWRDKITNRVVGAVFVIGLLWTLAGIGLQIWLKG